MIPIIVLYTYISNGGFTYIRYYDCNTGRLSTCTTQYQEIYTRPVTSENEAKARDAHPEYFL